MFAARYDSPLGPLLLTCDEKSLTGLWMNRSLPENAESHWILEETKTWLDAYFRGENRPVPVPVDPQGTAFQKQVWQLLRNIPYGETRTYGEIAWEMAALTGKEKMSAQAIGQAVGKNPISILIPCHRVIGAGGKLTGYAGGLEKKVWLLEHEAAKKTAG